MARGFPWLPDTVRRFAATVATVAAVALAPRASAEVIVKQGLSHVTVETVSALLDGAPDKTNPPRVVTLSGDFTTDLDRVNRAAAGESAVFAVGPNATVLAGTALQSQKNLRVVSVGVPNPERLNAPTDGISFVSFYPPLDAVFRFLKTKFNARQIGLLFTPSQNASVAAAFASAASARGLTLEPIEVRSAGDLVRRLKPGLAHVDVLVIPVDPLLFDADTLKIVASEAKNADKPTIGFLEELPHKGLTGAIVSSREALARTAWQMARRPPAGGKVVEVDGPMLYVSQDASTVVETTAEKPGEPKVKK